MSINRGKSFEAVIKESCEKVLDTYVLRLYDPQGGYSSVSNPCDYVVFRHGVMYMFECKAVHGNLLSIHARDPRRCYGNISNAQWEGLMKASQCGVVAGVLVWWVDFDVTKFIPIQELDILRNVGKRNSIRYDLDIPNADIILGQKKRVFFEYDMEAFFRNFE